RGGIEGAVGFDYRWPSQPWHFIFDLRFGKSRTATNRNSSNPSFSTFTSFITFSTFVVGNTANSSTTQATERESHLVADFMIGRDFGLGLFAPQFQFGVRVADLHAKAQALLNNQTTTTTTTFYTSGFPPPVILAGPTTTTTGTATFATWNSRFFGA